MVSWEIATTAVTIRLPLAGVQQVLSDDVLPTADVTALPGAQIVLRRGVTARRAGSTETRVVGLCVRASSADWSSGFEGLAFDKLDELTRRDLERRGVVDHFEAMPQVDDANRFERHYVADATLGLEKTKPRPIEAASAPGRKVHVEGHHLVGFVGTVPDLLVCSVSCAEGAGENVPACPTVLGALRFDGPFVTQPRGSRWAQWGGHLLRRPGVALGLLIGLGLFVLGCVLIALPGQRTSALR